MSDHQAALPSLAAWMLLGLLLYWLAEMAGVPITLAAGRELIANDGRRQMALIVLSALPVVAHTLGYLALRYWAFPLSRRSLLNAVALPLLVLAGMIVIAAITAWLTTLINRELMYWAIEADAVLGTPVLGAVLATVISAIALGVAGALAGLGLWLVERVVLHVLFGEAIAVAGPALLGAHVAGFTVFAVALFLLYSVLSAGDRAPFILPYAAFIGGRVAAVPHLWLTWLAWRAAARTNAA